MCAYLIVCCWLQIWVCGWLKLHLVLPLPLNTRSGHFSATLPVKHACICARAYVRVCACMAARISWRSDCRMLTSVCEHKRNQLIGLEPAPAKAAESLPPAINYTLRWMSNPPPPNIGSAGSQFRKSSDC